MELLIAFIGFCIGFMAGYMVRDNKKQMPTQDIPTLDRQNKM